MQRTVAQHFIYASGEKIVLVVFLDGEHWSFIVDFYGFFLRL